MEDLNEDLSAFKFQKIYCDSGIEREVGPNQRLADNMLAEKRSWTIHGRSLSTKINKRASSISISSYEFLIFLIPDHFNHSPTWPPLPIHMFAGTQGTQFVCAALNRAFQSRFVNLVTFRVIFSYLRFPSLPSFSASVQIFQFDKATRCDCPVRSS